MSGQLGDLVLQMTWAVKAPRERVFRALTEPTSLAQWWGPAGFTTPEIELDLEVGGAYRFGMQPPDGELFHLAGELLEVAPPRRLAYTFRWEEPDPEDQDTVVTLTLEDVDGITELSLHQAEFLTEARLSLHRDGWTDSLVKLQRLLESGPRAAGKRTSEE